MSDPTDAEEALFNKNLREAFHYFSKDLVDRYNDACKGAKTPANLTLEGLKALTDTIAEIAGTLQATISLAGSRRRALESRVAELESKGSLEYRGVFQKSTSYPRGSVVTDEGSVWVALVNIDGANERPSESRLWKMMIRRPRDGKDAR